MLRTDVFQIRIEPELRDRLARLRNERHVNVSAWARDVIAAALDRELPADLEVPRRQPLAGWKPCKLRERLGRRARRTRCRRGRRGPARHPYQHHRRPGRLLGRLRSPRSSPATRSESSSATPAGRRTSRYARHALRRPGVDRWGHRPRPGRSHHQRHVRKLAEQGRPTSRPPSSRPESLRTAPSCGGQPAGIRTEIADLETRLILFYGRDGARDNGSDVRSLAVSRQVTPNAA